MLRISRLTDYGLVILHQLAEADGRQMSAEQLMSVTGLNRATVRKVMKHLADANLVLTKRGALGGYRVVRPARYIRVLDVIRAFEGEVALTECSTAEQECEINATCSLANHWVGINQLLVVLLERISLADLQDPTLLQSLQQDLQVGNVQIQVQPV